MCKLKIATLYILLSLSLIPLSAQDNSLSLSDAITKALENNFGIIISKADADIAGINNAWGNAGRYPVISLDASNLNSYSFDNNTYSGRINVGLGLTWTIFDGFKVRLTKDKLQQLEKLAIGRSEIIVENTIEDIILGYFQVLLNEKRLEVLNKVMKLSEDRYNYELKRKEFGNSVTYNVLQAKNNFLNDNAAFLSQQVTLRNSIRNLNFLMGIESINIWNYTEDFNTKMEEYTLSDLLDKMMKGNVSLMNQYINILLAQNSRSMAKKAYYPSLRLSTGVENTEIFAPSVAKDNTFRGYGNFTLSLKLFQAGQRKRAVEIAKIEESIAGVEELELKRSLTNHLMGFYDDYSVRKELLSISRENMEAAELNMQISQEKYTSGAINSFNYRDVQLVYLNIAYQEIQAIYNLITIKTALTRITGGFINSGEVKDE